MKVYIGFIFLPLLLVFCSEKKRQKPPVIKFGAVGQPIGYWFNDSIGRAIVDTNYVPTGFYLLADSGKARVKMRKEHSDEIYAINPKPFVTVENVITAELQKLSLEGKVINELCMTMDEKGTHDLKKGIGNSLYPYVAVVVANRLLFVVENKSSVSNGVMCIHLYDYTEEEMQSMLDAVKAKE